MPDRSEPATSVIGAVLRVARPLHLARRPSPPPSATPAPKQPAPTPAHGPVLPIGRDPEGLTRWQAVHAGYRLGALQPDARRAVQAAMAAADPTSQGYLRLAVAAGRPAAEVVGLASLLASRPPEWAAWRLRLVDDVPGPQFRFGTRIDQVDGTTCGTTALLVLATSADPLLTLALTTPDWDPDGLDFSTRFDDRQRKVHGQSTRGWPSALGTSPWGMVSWLRRHGAGVGPYRVRLVDDGNPDDVAALIAEASAALDLGDPVPLLIGAGVPRHYVLALGLDGDGAEAGWLVFEPSSGEVRVVPVAAVRAGRLGRLLGFDRLHAALLPRV